MVFISQRPIRRSENNVCSGDFIEPETVKASELCLIEDTRDISFQVYPPEFIFAEKLETIARFGTGNTRVKDFIDLDTLIKKGLDIHKTGKAVRMCFKTRGRDFQVQALSVILNDTDFVEVIEEVLKNKREYYRLNLPDIRSLLKSIKNYIKRL